MGRIKAMLFAGAAALLCAPAASAADLPAIMPVAMPVVQDFSGWYLRGDIGVSNQRVGNLYNILYNDLDISVSNTDKSFDPAPFFVLGVGYQVNSWLRFDVTGEYRAKAAFHGVDNVYWRPAGSTGVQQETYTAKKSEWTALANAYVDLGTWWGITPFVGAGVGASYNIISGFTDNGTGTCVGPACSTPSSTSLAYGATAGKWNFAWAAYAGMAYRISPDLTVELAYRYLDLGKAQSGDLIASDGTNNRYNPMEFNHLTSHDVKLGLRWNLFAPEPAVYVPPMVRKG